MTDLAFAFAGPAPSPLSFVWPRLPPDAVRGVLCNRRLAVPWQPLFPGQFPPANVRANGVASAWKQARGAVVMARVPWRQSTLARAALQVEIESATLRAVELVALLAEAVPLTRTVETRWRDATILSTDARASARDTQLVERSVASVWRNAALLEHARRLVFRNAELLPQTLTAPWRHARPLGQVQRAEVQDGLLRAVELRIPWQAARVRAGLSWPWPPLPPLVIPPRRDPLRFHFHAPARPALSFHFGREPGWSIPILRSYRMLHSLDLLRLPELTSIPIASLEVASAWDEWAWSLTASLLGPDAVDLLRPVVSQAVEVEARLDGTVWQFRLDQVAGSVQFGQSGGQTQGRGRAALLGPEVALPVNGYETAALTARQLAEQELTGTDWQLDWQMVDWLVPAGRFSYSQKTPIEVITAIVETAGGRLMADPATAWLTALPRYPLPPWEWATAEPDIILPRDILRTLNWKPRHGQPWDAVYLGDGETVLAKVVRAGLPGTSLPDSPTVEPLLCHLDVCRARGIAILSDAAAGVDFTLALPLSVAGGASPLRAVGELARFEDGGKTWMGLITNVSAAARFGEAAQTLEVRAVEVTL